MKSRRQEKTDHAITALLVEHRQGKPGAMERLVPFVYERLRRIAAGKMRRENPRHTLQPTALVNEAFVKIVQGAKVDWQDRAHFFAVAANVMRQILVDHAKAKRAAKRGGGQVRVEFDERFHAGGSPDPDVLVLDRALKALAKISPRQAQIVELRYFGGLSVEETAEALELSPATVKRDWSAAKLWLYDEISSEKKEAA